MTQPDPDAAPLDVRLVPAALTSWAVTAAGILWGAWAPVAVVIGAVAVMAVASWCVQRPAAPVWSGVVAVLAIGCASGVGIGIRVHELARHPLVAHTGATVEAVVSPVESPRAIGGGRLMFRGAVHAIDGAESSGRVVVFASMAGFGELIAGQQAAFRARVARPNRPELTVAVLSAQGQPTLGDAAPWQRGAAEVRARFAAAAGAVLPPEQAGMLPALVLGDTSALTPMAVDDFRVAGLTHLTAVSGANVTIVCGAVLLTAALVGPRAAAVLAGLTLVAFVGVVQPSASVLRAAVMGAIALFAVVSRRRRQAVPALAATVLVLMITTPELAVDIGFALSVAATAGLVVIAPRWSARFVERGWPKPLADAVAVACAAQLVTAPLVAGLSGAVSVVSVLANLAVAVVIPPITVIGTAAAAVVPLWPAAARFLIRFTGPELWWLRHVARWAAAVPGAAVPVPPGLPGVVCVAAATAAGALAWRWQWGRIGVVGVLLCLVAAAAGGGGGVGRA